MSTLKTKYYWVVLQVSYRKVNRRQWLYFNIQCEL